MQRTSRFIGRLWAVCTRVFRPEQRLLPRAKRLSRQLNRAGSERENAALLEPLPAMGAKLRWPGPWGSDLSNSPKRPSLCISARSGLPL